MSVSVSSFQQSYPAFANETIFPTTAISYWLAIAQLMLNINGSGAPTVCSFTGSVLLGGELLVTAIGFGSLTLAQGPLLLAGQNVPAQTSIIEQLSGPAGGIGLYQLNITDLQIPSGNLVAVQGNFSASANTRWGISSPTPDVPPTTLADYAIGLFAAHNLALEQLVEAQAALGAPPIGQTGVLSSKSVGPASASYDVSAATYEDAGYFNMTIYGRRLWQLAMQVGAGPIQIGIGIAPPFSGAFAGNGGAWIGPWPYPQQGGVGFGG
jgi:hypothetical protein